MRQGQKGRAVFLLSLGLVVLMVGVGVVLSAPVRAGDWARDGQIVFATSTPRPEQVLGGVPQGHVEQYALRLWVTSDELVDVILSQIALYQDGETEQVPALAYSLFELEQRFPEAPQSFERREILAQALLTVPLDTLDTRAMMRPYALALFNQAVEAGASLTDTLLRAGVEITATALDFNNDNRLDALLHVRMRDADGVLRYEDFIPAIINADGIAQADFSADFPAYPFNGELTLATTDDLNADGQDEVALWLNTGEINAQLWVYGWREDAFINLIPPTETVLNGVDAPATIADGQIIVTPRQLESPLWNCQSQITQRWQYRANAFRAVPDDNPRRSDVVSVGCVLYRADPPLYSRLATDSITFITGALDVSSPASIGYAEAQVALAMLQVLNNDTAQAQARLDAIESPSPVVEEQITAMRVSLAAGLPPVQVCASMVGAEGAVGCDLDSVISRILTLNPLRRESDLRLQLEALGLPVAEMQTAQQVGRAERTYVRFALFGSRWWVFAPTQPEVYVASPGTPPPGYVAFADPPPMIFNVPQAALTELLAHNDVQAALTVFDNALRLVPDDVPLSLEAQYFQAFTYDRLGRRDEARDAYYRLWRDGLGSAWGGLAGAHLEFRAG